MAFRYFFMYFKTGTEPLFAKISHVVDWKKNCGCPGDMILSAMIRRLALLLPAAAPALASLASPPVHARQAPPPSPDADLLGYPPVNIGYYTFVSCSATQGQALTDLFSKTAAIITTTIVPALETPNPTPAQDPFPVFFADGNFRDHINATFTGILGQHFYHLDSPDRNWRPRIICLNNDDGGGGVPELERARAVCGQGIGPVSFTQDSGTSTVIYLCPAFFDLPALPTRTENCPTVDAAVDPTKYVRECPDARFLSNSSAGCRKKSYLERRRACFFSNAFV